MFCPVSELAETMNGNWIDSKTETMIGDWNGNSDGTYPESVMTFHYVKLINSKHIKKPCAWISHKK